MNIPLYKVREISNIGYKVEEIFASGKISNGDYVTKFENALKSYIGNPYVLTTADMSSSMTMCLYLAGVRSGDDVLISPLVCLATSCPIKNIFANTIWCDVNPMTGNIDPDDILRKITPRTKAIIVYHWAGNPAELARIYEIARDYKIKVIEDANEALGAEYNGMKIGATGADFTIFSFYPIRQLTTIEGAAISFSSEESYKEMLKLRRYGINQQTFRLANGEIDPSSDIKNAGWNSYMSNLSAMIGCSQVDELVSIIALHKANGIYYDEELSKLKAVRILNRTKNSLSAYWVYTFLCDQRDDLMAFLKENGINSSVVHIRNDIYSCFGEPDNKLDGVSYFSRKSISIPCGWWLSIKQREHIVQRIKQFYNKG